MRVLVLWADPNSANLGVRVLASGMESLARRAWGDDIEVDFQDFGPGDSQIGFGGRSVMRDWGRPRGPITSKVREYDIVLDSGAGDSFTDFYGLKRLAIICYAHRAARKSGVPLILGPQTIGPFAGAVARMLARTSLRDAAAVIARDAASVACSADLGVPAHHSTDVVFALDQPEARPERDVVLNVSGLLWAGHRSVDRDRYRTTVLRTISGIRDLGRELTLMPHVLDNPSSDNDARIVGELLHAAGGMVEVVVPRDLGEARSTLAGARLVIGARMHACLNALSAGTPAVAWAYSRKFDPLLRDLRWPYVLDLRTNPNVAEATLELLVKPEIREQAMLVRTEAAARLAAAADVMRGAVQPTGSRGSTDLGSI